MIIIFDLHGVIFDYHASKYTYDIFILQKGLEILQACASQKDAHGNKKHQIYILSNWGKSGFEKLKKQHGAILDLFDGHVISGECGYSKPNSEIFELLINRYNLANQECIFIDDSVINVNAANKFGWKAIHYQDPEHVLKQLKKILEF